MFVSDLNMRKAGRPPQQLELKIVLRGTAVKGDCKFNSLHSKDNLAHVTVR